MQYIWLILLVLSFDCALAQSNESVVVDYSYLLNQCDSILNVDSGDCYAKFNRAVALNHLGKYDKALSDITYAIEVCKDSVSAAFYTRARIFQKSGRYSNAIDDYIAAVNLNERRSIEWDEFFQIGFCYAQQQKNRDAIECYSQAIDIAPSEGILYYNRGLIFYYMDNKKDGCADLNEALVLGIKQAQQVLEDICN
ncbi:MAG TPA: tetratricopeptide repeat protein [Chitinophagales bacterium]|nr:tetratricopeptide repeat protein [Chitinophagales bacterium]